METLSKSSFARKLFLMPVSVLPCEEGQTSSTIFLGVQNMSIVDIPWDRVHLLFLLFWYCELTWVFMLCYPYGGIYESKYESGERCLS